MSNNPPPPVLDLLVTRKAREAEGVVGLELRHPDRQDLPPFDPGSHLEVHLANGLVRHYSLCNDAAERHRYCLGVGLPADSRGGSRFMHEVLKVGDTLRVSPPRNLFPLASNAAERCFIAGGIGITPILAMTHDSRARGLPFRLFYCARSRRNAAFLDTIRDLAGDRLVAHFDDEHDGKWFDARAALATVPCDAHIYCCGPAPLMKAVEEAGSGRPAGHLHFEWFAPKIVATTRSEAFEVVIRSTGQRIRVPAESSLLTALEEHDVLVPCACREGLCGTCQTGVLSGVPDHRDSVLSDTDRASNQTMIVCVSRARTPALELDL